MLVLSCTVLHKGHFILNFSREFVFFELFLKVFMLNGHCTILMFIIVFKLKCCTGLAFLSDH